MLTGCLSYCSHISDKIPSRCKLEKTDSCLLIVSRQGFMSAIMATRIAPVCGSSNRRLGLILGSHCNSEAAPLQLHSLLLPENTRTAQQLGTSCSNNLQQWLHTMRKSSVKKREDFKPHSKRPDWLQMSQSHPLVQDSSMHHQGGHRSRGFGHQFYEIALVSRN